VSSVAEIEAAIESLPEKDRERLESWFIARDDPAAAIRFGDALVSEAGLLASSPRRQPGCHTHF